MALYDNAKRRVKPSGWRNKTRVELRKRAMPAGSPLTSIYDGQTCIGFTVARGKLGIEAFTADGKSRGIHPTRHEAAKAITNGEATS